MLKIPVSRKRPSEPLLPAKRRRSSFVLLRTVPGDSPLHRMWAGTKLLAVAILSVCLSLRPSWAAIGLTGVVVFAAMLIGRIPRGAAPRPPRWFWLVFAVGAALTLRAGGSPYWRVGGDRIGFGAFETDIRLTLLVAVLLGASALVGWTTPIADVAPALSRLAAPLRVVRLPVDEWAITTGLCVRCLPLIAGELRTLAAARRLRPRPNRGQGWWQAQLGEVADLLTAALAVSLRRASELALAIEARGGAGLARSPVTFRLRDALALLGAAATGAAAFLLPS
jgi:energy-coupling factor transport system permease protein